MLHHIPIFQGLSESDLAIIEKNCRRQTYPAQTIIISEGDITDSLFVIRSGRVKIFLSDSNGKEVVVGTRGVGDYIGELAPIDDAERSASVVTLEKSSFTIITKSVFKQILSTYPDIALNIMKDLSEKVRTLDSNVKSLALRDVRERVIEFLINHSIPEGQNLIMIERFTQQDIADRIGASREMVARILGSLRDAGYLESAGRKMIMKRDLNIDC